MSDLNSLQKEIDALKKKTSRLEKRLATIEYGSVDIPEPKEVPKKKSKQKDSNFEADFGQKWLGKIGILALVLGIAFFIKYAFDNQWIGHLARILLGVAIGIALIVGGEFFSRKEKYSNWSMTLIGGGLAIVYFSVYAAYHFEEYRIATGISQIADILLLIAVVVFATIYSLKKDSQIIAGESFFLGFVTSLLSNKFETISLVYGAVLTFGLIAVVSIKKWRVMGIVGIFASYLLYAVWHFQNPGKFELKSVILISYFVAFSIQAFLLNSKENDENIMNSFLVAANYALFFLMYYFQFTTHFKGYYLSFALFAIALAFYIFGKDHLSEIIRAVHLYAAIFFLTITVPILVDAKLISIFWSLEFALVALLGLKLESIHMRICAYILALLNLGNLISAQLINAEFRIPIYLAAVACYYFVYFFYSTEKKSLEKEEQHLIAGFSLCGGFILAILIALEGKSWITPLWCLFAFVLCVIAYRYEENSMNLSYKGLSVLIVLKLIFYDIWKLNALDFQNILESHRFFSFLVSGILFYIIANMSGDAKDENVFEQFYSWTATLLMGLLILIEFKGIWISLGWSILGIMLIAAGFLLEKKFLRLQGLALFAIAVVKVFLFDTSALSTLFRTISFIVLGIILLSASFLYAKYKDKLKEVF